MRIIPSEKDLLSEFIEAKAARDSAQSRLDEIQERLTKQMEADQQKSFDYNREGIVGKVTYVRSKTTKVDEPGLRKALTAKVFDKYTTKKLDKKAMEEAMDAGTIDPVVVSKYVQVEYAKPYLRVTAEDKREN